MNDHAARGHESLHRAKRQGARVSRRCHRRCASLPVLHPATGRNDLRLARDRFVVAGVVEGSPYFDSAIVFCNAETCHLGSFETFAATITKVRSRRKLPDCSLNGNWPQHVIGVQFQGAAPQGRLEDVVDMFGPALFSGLDKQSGPFKRAQDAGGERGHFAPSGIVPIMLFPIEGRK